MFSMCVCRADREGEEAGRASGSVEVKRGSTTIKPLSFLTHIGSSCVLPVKVAARKKQG